MRYALYLEFVKNTSKDVQLRYFMESEGSGNLFLCRDFTAKLFILQNLDRTSFQSSMCRRYFKICLNGILKGK